jgi:hypothetical protein
MDSRWIRIWSGNRLIFTTGGGAVGFVECNISRLIGNST